VCVTIAVLATAVSGLVLSYPASLIPVFGVSLLEWRTIHKWSALVLAVAVVAHLVANRRRLGAMIVRLWQPAGPPEATPRPADARPQDVTEVPEERDPAAPDEQPTRLRLNRRWFLLLAAGALAAVIAALGLDRGGARPRGGSGPAGLLDNFPVLNVEDGPPPVAAASWVLEVDGLVESPLRLERDAWLALPRTQETRDFHCVEGWSVDQLGWEGVRVSDVLTQAKPQAAAQFVTFHAYGGTYTDSLTLAEANAPETLLADALDGAPLPGAHGGPLRLVIPSQLGYKSVKWVMRLELTATRTQGYWERNGDYPAEAPVV
jgi:hypothetical protein